MRGECEVADEDRHGEADAGPLVAGIILLGWLGTAGKETDVMAHVLGFGIGVLLGATAATSAVNRYLHNVRQWPAGLATS